MSMALHLMRTYGLTQLLDRDPGGSYCLTGALMEAAGDDDALYRRALQSVGERLNVPACSVGGYGWHRAIIRWDDQEGRTQHAVIAKLQGEIRAHFVASPC